MYLITGPHSLKAGVKSLENFMISEKIEFIRNKWDLNVYELLCYDLAIHHYKWKICL